MTNKDYALLAGKFLSDKKEAPHVSHRSHFTISADPRPGPLPAPHGVHLKDR